MKPVIPSIQIIWRCLASLFLHNRPERKKPKTTFTVNGETAWNCSMRSHNRIWKRFLRIAREWGIWTYPYTVKVRRCGFCVLKSVIVMPYMHDWSNLWVWVIYRHAKRFWILKAIKECRYRPHAHAYGSANTQRWLWHSSFEDLTCYSSIIWQNDHHASLWNIKYA